MPVTKFNADGDEIGNESKKRSRKVAAIDESADGEQADAPSDSKKQRVAKEVEKFSELDMPKELMAAVSEFGFEKMTEIQKKSIPQALANDDYDIIAQAKTGSGKTIAFLIPIMSHLIQMKKEHGKNLGVGALVLAPTRELAIQIEGVARKLIDAKSMKSHGFKMCLILGGAPKNVEQQQLQESNLIIATPGRCLDHLTNTQFNYKNLKYLVLDEADQLIDSGFDQTIKMIVIKLPKDKMTYLFSATMTAKVEDLAVLSLRKNPLRIGLQDSTTVSTLDQKFVQVPADKKLAALLHILQENEGKKMICFVAIKKAVDYVAYLLEQCGVANIALHGSMTQQKRTQTFHDFMAGKTANIMICTDVAARGLDFPNVDLIIQCDLPEQFSNYFHRIGRTARAGKKGTALLMLTPKEISVAMGMIKMYLKSAKQGGNKDATVNEEELLQEYKLTASEQELNKKQQQICDLVYNDSYMYYEAPQIVRTYSGVFDMFARKMGFGRNDFDQEGLQSSFGMKSKGGASAGGYNNNKGGYNKGGYNNNY